MSVYTNGRARILYLIAALIALLLLANAMLMYRNSRVIETNRQLQIEAENAKVYTVAIIRNVHLLDLGIRGFVLTKDANLLSSLDSSKMHRDKIMVHLEHALLKQDYHDLPRLHALRDSIVSYFNFIDEVLMLSKSGRDDLAKLRISEDRGLQIWLLHKAFTQDLNEFENNIMVSAEKRYTDALQNTYLLQLAIFLLTVPAIFYMAYYAARTFQISQQLQRTEEEKNRILTQQNEMLDRLVKEKTQDIQAQNEEIVAQNEEIRAHNDQLIWQQKEIQDAKEVIEQQSKIIEAKNLELTNEVQRQTQDIREANKELIAYNSRLQQFTYIISHNLRAPLARLKGLANVMEHTSNAAERDQIFKLIVQSSYELDTVISDLGTILSIDQSNTLVKTEINLNQSIQKVLTSLNAEIKTTHARVTIDLDKSITINCLAPYVESIFHNLISNSIKYRNPEKPLEIRISSGVDDKFISIHISDNGLGIDLEKHGGSLFNLYKRFHLHVEGKGLGLYLVKTQIEALGGKIAVSSKVDEGTTFAVYFPR